MEKNRSANLLVLKAAWVLPMDQAAIKDGGVLIAGNCIEQIVPECDLSKSLAGREHQVYDYGQAIILPGLINLHTHLEHTNLRHLAKETAFLEWLPGLMKEAAKWSFDDRAESAKAGIAEIMTSGTTCVVDWSYSGASVKALAASGLRAIIGLEIFGVNEAAANETWQQWLARYEKLLEDDSIAQATKQGRISITAAPHAPYTVCPALWRKSKEWAETNNRTLLTHVAESEAEYNWFHNNDESMKQFLIAAFSQRDPDFSNFYEKQIVWKAENLSPVQHLDKHGLLADNLLAAHAVQIDDLDINLLRSANVAIAHCPRSNKMLKCGKAPLEKLLDKGLAVGLGTDGAASSGDLNLLTEARYVAHGQQKSQQAKKLSAKQILELLTIKAAACLGLENKLGSLTPGKWADIAVFSAVKGKSINNSDTVINHYEMLLSGQLAAKALFVNGVKV